jgi:hypothetical protein
MRAQRRLAALWLLLACLHHASPMPLGVTLPELNEYGVLWPFGDLMKHAAPPSPAGAGLWVALVLLRGAAACLFLCSPSL